MKRISADHGRTVDISGTPFPRPVDIDQAQTGFKQLRSLRIYRFAAGSVIDGHAEEDEVLIVVLAGAIQLTLTGSGSAASPQTYVLKAATDPSGSPCVAYLPPEGQYQLLAKESAEVAYARATPADGPPPTVFYAQASPAGGEVSVLLEEFLYPRLLRIRLLEISSEAEPLTVQPLEAEKAASESLVHVRTRPEGGTVTMVDPNAETLSLSSWDTMALASGDKPTLAIAKESSALILIVTCPC